ncbi:TetR/AcrR family transcriptional regulator [Allorhizocola rhizosphaerae]|uniref:TetR/AcrR family transcriptional regulator n=1 Tax=Allorhizocola rhizosphaerae TaxID=1872709 RepID=UPI0013C2F3E7|nr:TetR/AcrR family transcriptional regulator [Allorhizocola rhizosphaerae]
MPKLVDQEARRRLIADTVVRIIGTRGLEAASVRNVATEAGVSAGAVQRCFATKDDLLRFVLRHVNERFKARVLARVTDPADTDAGLRIVIDEMLPLDAERRLESATTLALLAHSAIDPACGEIMRSAYAGAHAFFATRLGKAGAVSLYALISGLQGPLLVGAITAEQAWSIVEDRLP